jgi:hypothetical protein
VQFGPLPHGIPQRLLHFEPMAPFQVLQGGNLMAGAGAAILAPKCRTCSTASASDPPQSVL